MQNQTLWAGDAPPVVAVDVSNLTYRAFYIHRNLAYKSQLTGHIFGFLRTVFSFAKAHPGCEWWWALDGHNSNRRKIDPEYKANRTHADLPISITDEIQERVLGCLPGVSWFHPGYEADDLIAQMVRSTSRPVTVFSNDRDLWTCLRSKRVRVYDGKDFVDECVVRARFGVAPAQIPLIKAVYGDQSDHVKAANTRIQKDKFVAALGVGIQTLADLAEALPQLEPGIRERLERAWPKLKQNYRLVRLRSKPDPKVVKTRGATTTGSLIALLEQTGCRSLLRELDRTFGFFALPSETRSC
jgi:5'-3' exonuclease